MFVLGDLINGKSLASLAESTRTALQNIAPQIQTTWFKQHDADGAHKDVTATRVRAGQLGAGARVAANTARAASLAPIQVAEGVTLISINTPAAGTDLYGIYQPGAQIGDIVAVCADKDSGGVLRIHHLANTSPGPGTVPPGTEIGWDALFFTTSPLQLSIASHRSPLLLMYLQSIGSQRSNGWGILRGLTP